MGKSLKAVHPSPTDFPLGGFFIFNLAWRGAQIDNSFGRECQEKGSKKPVANFWAS
jgi:hypothetical protein